MSIKIIEKPSYITYEQIHDLLWKANEENRKVGFHLSTAEMSGEELAIRIGKEGKCFVALDGNKLVGTLSLRMLNRNSWYYKGIIPDYMLAAVDPEYQGKHINSMLSKFAFDFVKKVGYPAIELDVAENNCHAIKVYNHLGFKFVDYKIIEKLDHNNIVMIKWLNEKHPNYKMLNIYYRLRKYSKCLKHFILTIKRNTNGGEN
ncbi:MAG: GNAT family N-acetyltransferase [Clostridiales bacterium]|nr:GNAT family N-acetyltransferase [Clostridiales bacterium]